MENLQVVQLFAGTRKLDRLAGDRSDRERRTSAGVAVELGKDDAVDAERLVEFFSYIDRVLTGHRVDDEQDLVRVNFIFDILQLLHQLFVDVQAAGGVEDNDVVAVVFGMLDRVFGDLHRADGSHLKDGGVHLCADHLQLLNRGRTVDVAGDQQRAASLLAEHFGKLCRVGGLTGTLQTAHHDDGWDLGRKVDAAVGGTHQLGQLVAHDLDDLLRRGQAGEDLLADSLFGDLFDKVLGHLVVDVRFQQGQADLPHRFLDVVFGKLSFRAQLFKRCVELFRKSFECHRSSSLSCRQSASLQSAVPAPQFSSRPARSCGCRDSARPRMQSHWRSPQSVRAFGGKP